MGALNECRNQEYHVCPGEFGTVVQLSTDGIDVASRDLGPDFPRGLFVAVNSAARNFLLFRWTDIQRALGQPVARAPADAPHR